MKNQRAKLTINLIVIICTLSVSLTSFLYLSYAWFAFARIQRTDVMAITVESGVEFELKYFKKNYPVGAGVPGYPNPTSVLLPADRITVDNYATDFAPIAEDPMIGLDQTVRVGNGYPGLRLTYALEVTGDFIEDKTIDMILGGYSAPPSTTLFNSVTTQGITLATATNIYATALDVTGNLTTQANAFVTNLTALDLFSTSTPYGPSNLMLATDTLTQTHESLIFLFTIEFSNLSNTFYSYSYTNQGRMYYVPSTSGNSNVYKDLIFAITLIRIDVS